MVENKATQPLQRWPLSVERGQWAMQPEAWN
jgi:hypothetical protein